jgi:hypothetical protein
MLVLASTAVTIIFIIAILIVLAIALVAFGPLTRSERARDDLDAEMGPLGVTGVGEEPEEARPDEGGLYSEERLDRENE